jgi:hypothetical protein
VYQNRSAALTPKVRAPDVEAGAVEIVELVLQKLRTQVDLVGHGIVEADTVEVPVPTGPPRRYRPPSPRPHRRSP